MKLIKQMKEDSDRVRQWKLTKEKEVNHLKQKDRRAQVQIVKMERYVGDTGQLFLKLEN